MVNQIAQREKARRVWRLNKKEGVPVLDALETVEISKDVYYRIKREWEEKWEEEILTVEQIQKRLSEVDEKLEERENQIESVRERLDEARSDLADIDSISEAVEQAHANDGRIFRLEEDMEITKKKVDTLTRHTDLSETGLRTNDELRESVKKTEERMKRRVGEVQSTTEDVTEVLNSHTERLNALEERIEEIEDSDGSGGLLG